MRKNFPKLLLSVFFLFVLGKAAISQVVISQVYGGGGNTGATYRNDFIEIFNRGNTTQSLAGWSVQYSSAGGTSWTVTNLTGSIAPGQYYLIQEAAGTGGTTNLPVPDAAGTIAMGASAGKVALVNSTAALTGSGCPFFSSVIDFVAFGTGTNCAEGTAAPAPSATVSILRVSNGCTDDNNNSTDFSTGTVNPRNTSSPLNICGTTATTVSVAAGANAAEPATNGTFIINLSSPAPAGGVTVTYTLGGTATVNTDYTDSQGGSIIITEGNTSATIILPVIDDNLSEAVETISIALTTATSPFTIAAAAASINLTSDDISPVPLVNSYTQDFNTLVNTGTGSLFTLPQGWAFSESGTSGNTTYTAGSGSGNSGDTYSFGTGTNTDRAFGGLQSGGVIPTIGAAITNNSGTLITALKITFTGEQWRLGATARQDKLDFQYSTDAANLTGGTWNDVDQLDFIAPVHAGTLGALDGNISPNRTLITYSIAGLSIPAGATFFLRWTDLNASGADDGLGIDDFTIEANPTDPFPPVITALSPANGNNNAAANFTAAITFDETVIKGSGNITLKKTADNSIVQVFDVNSPAISVAATKVSFAVSGLDANTGYYFEMDNDAFRDQSGNSFTGITGNSTWTFTTNNNFFLSDFQTCSPSLSDGFSQFSETGAAVWGCTAFGHDPADATGIASLANGVQMNGFTGGTNVPNVDWLISPSLNLTNTTYPLLSFWSRTAFNGLPLQLKVSTDYTGGDPSAATWTDVNGKFPAQTTNKWTLSSNINLSAYKQPNVHFAFVYTSSDDDGARWTVDDIAVENSPVPPPPDITIGTADIQFPYAAGGTTTDKTFTFIGNDLTDEVTVSSTGAFLLSKDGVNFTTSILFLQSEANNVTENVYVRFAPSVNDQNYTGLVTVTTGSLNGTVNLKGTSIDPETTLEVVNWNMEWFGSTSLGPTNNDLQEQNAETVLKNANVDIYGLVEVVDESRLARIVSHMPGYSYVICNYGSHTNPFESGAGSINEAQKEAFVYKTALFSNISTKALVTDGVNTAADLSNPAYNYFSSGRYPFMLTADITLNGITRKTSFVLLHAKANTSPTVTSYARRKAGSDTLKYTLNNLYPDDNIIILGDINDDLDSTITDGINPKITSYIAFTSDTVTTYSSPTLALSLAGKKSTVSFNDIIDHVLLSNEISPYYMPASANILTDVATLINNYGSTTSDHYPAFTRYQFCKLTCPADITTVATEKQCGTIVNFDVASTMSCGTVTAAPASGSFFPVGVTTVTVTASTGETCSFKVTVTDGESPTISNTADQTKNTAAGTCSYRVTDVSFDPSAADNCTGVTLVNDYTNTSTLAGAVLSKGEHVIIWTATDGAGNSASATQTITIKDQENPIINSCPFVPVLCYQASGNYAIPVITATDNCGMVTYSYSITGATNRNGNGNNASGTFNTGTGKITWTVSDESGNTSTCETTVQVNNQLSVAVPDAFALPSGTLVNTVYIGYIPASSITISAQATGGTPGYTYLWSTGAVTATITVSPLTATAYTVTVTDIYGCTATFSKTIRVIDIRGGKNLDKVIICHKNFTSIVAQGDVAGHLSHGDMLGSCSIAVAINTTQRNMTEEVSPLKLNAWVLPNPSVSHFIISTVSGNNQTPVTLMVTDLSGRLIEQRTNLKPGQTISLGQQYQKGVYLIHLFQGTESVSMKLIKL
ncbi:MAG: choice-of-anchor J domain-containing protein [Sphingobacteriales bacterium]